jgi:anti-anti-sigma factor
MPATGFDARVRRRGDVAVVDLAGELDARADEALTRALDAAADGRPATILLNFTRVSYINSTGIALIVGVLAQARKAGGKVLSCGLSDHYREIFEITRLTDFVHLYPDEDSAVAAASSSEKGGGA